MDGIAYALEMGGDDDAAEGWKSDTEYLRIAATILTLPDLAYGSYKAVKEIMEIREARALPVNRALRADELAAKTESAARAERFKKVAKLARERAEKAMNKIKRGLELEVAPRVSGAGSAGLLVREEVENDESAMHKFISFLQVHCTAVQE